MRVGILTYGVFNYGAALQAYALQEALKEMGHDVQIVDYWTENRVKNFHSPWVKSKGARAWVMNAYILMHFRRWQRRIARFAEFRAQFMQLSRRRYFGEQDLLESPPGCDAYVCGSDQVWNPSKELDPVYFLRFAKKLGKRLVSYAPSFGVPEVPENRREECARYLKDFDALSVREKNGQEIIRDLSGRTSKMTCDPVCLLTPEQWRERIKPEEMLDRPYILVYPMRIRKTMMTMVKRLKQLTGLPVVLIPSENPASGIGIPADRVVWDAGPREFLQWIMGASLMCTSSFHGTTLAAIFQKPLYSVQYTARDSRMTNLLEQLGLGDVIVTDADHHLPSNPLSRDYTQAATALAHFRHDSQDYLNAALESKPSLE